MTARLTVALAIAASFYRLINHRHDWPELLAAIAGVIVVTHFLLRWHDEEKADETEVRAKASRFGGDAAPPVVEDEEDDEAPSLTLLTTASKGRRGLSG